MKELTLQQIQNRELQILVQFDSVCQKEGFRYSLGGGTLLGAVRHKGFIPWDDDIDVMMPRPDYDQFLMWCEKHETPFDVLDYKSVRAYNNPFAKLSDPGTVIEDENLTAAYTIGVNIDVFPIEGLGETEKAALKRFRSTAFARELQNAALWKRYFRSKTHSIMTEPLRLLLFLISRFVNPKKLLQNIDRKNRAVSFDDARYAGCVWGAYREREIMTQETYAKMTDLPFEGEMFQAIEAWDAYLEKHYGNYMQLPPEEKRISHHSWRAYLREETE
ncbi:MAG: LicD family protein [Clostridia bacterium]|nr:LicD family protein [Clostridia bacterium]